MGLLTFSYNLEILPTIQKLCRLYLEIIEQFSFINIQYTSACPLDLVSLALVPSGIGVNQNEMAFNGPLGRTV